MRPIYPIKFAKGILKFWLIHSHYFATKHTPSKLPSTIPTIVLKLRSTRWNRCKKSKHN